MHVLHVVGARPNFMKVAPVYKALAARPQFTQTLVHTGQHYDPSLSDIFFDQLSIPRPHVCLEVGSGSHAVQTANVMLRFEETMKEKNPDVVLVYGDINSTVAATLVAAKEGVCVCHVEAGLRSRDRAMPEELNRLVTDQLADLLFTPSPEADINLINEGIDKSKIHYVGNVMIDTALQLAEKATMPQIDGLNGEFALLTMHRPSNVDDPQVLQRLMNKIVQLSEQLEIVFPVHPRTKSRLEAIGFQDQHPGLHLIDPIGYLECLALQRGAKIVMTDSGGLQEETTAFGVPCLTIRENTERPVTISEGTNTLVGTDTDLLEREFLKVLRGEGKVGRVPDKWDGKASDRIAETLLAEIAVPPCKHAAA